MLIAVAVLLGFAAGIMTASSGLPRLSNSIRHLPRWRRLGPPAWLLFGILSAVVAVNFRWLVGFWCLIFIGGVATKVVWDHRRRALRQAREREVARACSYFAGLIRIGLVPSAALARAAVDEESLRSVAATAGFGGDVAAALAEAGRKPGSEGFAQLSLAWRISERTGVSLLSTLAGVVSNLKGQQERARVVRVELAGPRASGRLMAALPFVGLAFGFGFGGNPVEFLFATPWGRMCLVLGVSLAGAGLLWSERLATRAGDP